MTNKEHETRALERIERDCQSGDLEMNGCKLDGIIEEFLRSAGFSRLADAMDSVDCWRA